jgi:L-asparaginase / beta-aspartyl-peptidase
MATPGWCIILHGGCADACPDIDRQRDIKQKLSLIAKAAAITLDQGAHAKDVIVQVISALEDCPSFNAGKGSALTADGTHEVRGIRFALSRLFSRPLLTILFSLIA